MSSGIEGQLTLSSNGCFGTMVARLSEQLGTSSGDRLTQSPIPLCRVASPISSKPFQVRTVSEQSETVIHTCLRPPWRRFRSLLLDYRAQLGQLETGLRTSSDCSLTAKREVTEIGGTFGYQSQTNPRTVSNHLQTSSKRCWFRMCFRSYEE